LVGRDGNLFALSKLEDDFVIEIKTDERFLIFNSNEYLGESEPLFWLKVSHSDLLI
jgi:hypothetical protein